MLAINLGDVAATATIDLRGAASAANHDEYRLTSYPRPGEVAATAVALNGQELQLQPFGLLPELKPVAVPGARVEVAPKSATFATFYLK